MALSFLKITTNKLFKSADKIQDQSDQSKRVAKNIGKTLESQSLFKRQSIAKKENIYQKRKDGIRRRNQKDLFEAAKSTSPIQKVGRVVSNSSKGFLGRILNAISIAMVGWAVLNLPKIILFADQLGERITKVAGLMTSFMTNTFSIMTEIGSLSAILIRDLATFDFSEMGRQVNDSLSKVKTSFNRMENDFRESLQELVKPFDFGEDEKEPEKEPRSQLPPGQPPTTGGNSDFWTLVAVASREDSDPQGQADVAQSIYNRAASGAYGSKNIKDIILRYEQYQPTWDYPKKGKYGTPNPEWYQITDAQSAAKASGYDINTIKGVAANLLNKSLQKKAAEFVQGRTDFKGYDVPGSIQRKSGDNWFGWEYNYRGKTTAPVPDMGASPTTPPAQTAPLPSGFDPNKRYKPGDKVATGAEVGAEVTSRRGWRWGRMHGGIDVAMPSGTIVSCRYDCVIKEARSQSGYGHYVDVIIPALSVRIRLAHLTAGAYFFKGAPSGINSLSINHPAGKPLVRSGNTGTSTGPHLHLEATKNMGGVGYGGADPNYVEPDPYIDAFIFTTNAPAGVIAEKPLSQISGTRRGARASESITPEQKDKTIVVAAPATMNQNPAMISGSPDGSPIIISGDGLNSLIKQRVLLELAYT